MNKTQERRRIRNSKQYEKNIYGNIHQGMNVDGRRQNYYHQKGEQQQQQHLQYQQQHLKYQQHPQHLQYPQHHQQYPYNNNQRTHTTEWIRSPQKIIKSDTPKQFAGSKQISYIPYEQKYIQYEQQLIYHPIEKCWIDYYQIEQITDYYPHQKYEKIIQMVPEQKIIMKKIYIPVEKKIVHYPTSNYQDNFKERNNGIQEIKNQKKRYSYGYQQRERRQQLQLQYQQQQQQKNSIKTSSRKRTNYVTSDGYNPSYRQSQILSRYNNNHHHNHHHYKQIVQQQQQQQQIKKISNHQQEQIIYE